MINYLFLGFHVQIHNFPVTGLARLPRIGKRCLQALLCNIKEVFISDRVHSQKFGIFDDVLQNYKEFEIYLRMKGCSFRLSLPPEFRIQKAQRQFGLGSCRNPGIRGPGISIIEVALSWIIDEVQSIGNLINSTIDAS